MKLSQPILHNFFTNVRTNVLCSLQNVVCLTLREDLQQSINDTIHVELGWLYGFLGEVRSWDTSPMFDLVILDDIKLSEEKQIVQELCEL